MEITADATKVAS